MREIIGNTTATPNPRPDWLQNDDTKADYIKNKPTVLTEDEIINLINENGGSTGDGGNVDLSSYPMRQEMNEAIAEATEDVVKHTDFTMDNAYKLPFITVTEELGEPKPKLVASPIGIENLATRSELEEATEGAIKFSAHEPNLTPWNLVMGSPYEDEHNKALIDSGISTLDVQTTKAFQGGHDGEIVYVEPRENPENIAPEDWTYSIKPSGVKIDDIVLKSDLSDVETALDSIIAIQNTLMGGESE